ncbi:MAG: hypothetical protein HQ592_00500 [Planctomycetes bacterium]|nr:hypothetical protein [Planctomycetota bacterium]
MPNAPDGSNGWFLTLPEITLTATDTGIGAKEIHYWWNEETPTVVQGNSAMFVAPPGVNTLHYFAVDGLDQAEDEQQLVINHDDSAPSVSIELAGAVGDAGQYEGDVTATVVTEGDGIEILSVEIKMDDAGWTEYAGPIAVTGEGEHSVRARITTARGRTVEAEESFVIDFNPPVTVSETDPTAPNGQGGWFVIWAPTITLTATDAGGSVQEIRYRWNDEAETVVAGTSAAFAAPEGANTLHYYAVDEFGHAEVVQQTEIKFDPKKPDLVVESVAVDPSVDLLFGDVVTITWLVRNVGEGQAAFGWFDRASLSAPGAECADATLGIKPFNGVLMPGESYTETMTVTLPTGSCYEAGQYSIVVTTNFTHVMFEADTSNNSRAAEPITIGAPPSPDLVVANIFAEPEAFAGQEVAVTWTVTNNGPGDADGSWIDRVYLSDDDIPSGDDVLLGAAAHEGLLGAEQSYLETAQVRLPDAPGTYWLVVQTDADDVVSESAGEGNNAAVDDVTILVWGYEVTVSADVDQAPAGSAVVLSGGASAGGAPIPGVPVSVRILRNGFRRVISAETDAGGAFSVLFNPLVNEAGTYEVAAARPGVAEDLVQDTFVLFGMKLDVSEHGYDLTPGTPLQGEVTLTNITDLPLTGLTASVEKMPGNLEVQVDVDPISDLAGSGSVVVGYTLTAAGSAVPGGRVVVTFASAEGAAASLQLNLRVRSLEAELVATPGTLESGMPRGKTTMVSFEVRNIGGAPTDELSVMLPVVPWLSLLSPATIPSLEPGEATAVTLVLSPAADQELLLQRGKLVLTDDSRWLSVPFKFRVVSEAKGNLEVIAVDEFTYHAKGKPKVAGADVLLRDPYSGEVLAQAVTDENGEATFTDLPEAYYDLRVDAASHSSFRRTISISPEGTLVVVAYLPRQLVTHRWTVLPTLTEDRYEFSVETVFETNVPAPVVVVEPAFIDLRKVTSDTVQVDLKITNHGLVAASGFSLTGFEHDAWVATPLIEDIGELQPLSTVVVPIVFHRAASDARTISGSLPDHPALRFLYHILCGGPRYYGGEVPVIVSDAGRPNGGPPVPSIPLRPSSGGGSGGGSSPGSSARGTSRIYPFATSVTIVENPLDCLKMWWNLTKCVLGFVPGGSCALDVSILMLDYLLNCRPLFSRDCLLTVIKTFHKVVPTCMGKEVPLGKVWTILACFKALMYHLENLLGAGNAITVSSAKMQALTSELEVEIDRLEAIAACFTVFFGDEAWLNVSAEEWALLEKWTDAFSSAIEPASDGGEAVSDAERLSLLQLPLPDPLTAGHVEAMIDRWNRTLEYWEIGILNEEDVPPGQSTDFIAVDRFQVKLQAAADAAAASMADGHDNLLDGLVEIEEKLVEELVGEQGICARVKLEIRQDAVIARSAFAGTLEIDNDSAGQLTQVGVDIQITDEAGAPANDLFGIRPPELSGLTGVDGTGTLAAGAAGVAQWIIIPTSEAAPNEPRRYFMGGTLRYVVGDAQVSISLFPEPIVVMPNPKLRVKYFLERDVYSDDPFTPRIEPAIPFSLGLMMTNIGKGAARNVWIESKQPEIVEREKGLLVDFSIIGAQVGGDPVSPLLDVNLGDIEAGRTAVARWLMTATLEGTFTEYSATFTHVDDLGDPHLSVVDEVTIHLMSHLVRVHEPEDDGILDFLTDDVSDVEVLPDTIHSSDGSVLAVNAVTDGSIDGPPVPGDFEVELTAAMPSGWAYLRVPDPGEDEFRLVSVVRSDGKTLPVENAWTTSRTQRPLGEPEYREHLLHILDFDSTGSYTLVYEVDVLSTDRTPPTSTVSPLPPETRAEQFEVRWSGNDEDDGSGLAFYKVFLSTNGEDFEEWLPRTTATGAIFEGEQQNCYAFYSIAVDAAGNIEEVPITPDAQTCIPDMVPPPITVGLDPSSDGGAPGDNITNDDTPTLIGTTEALATVTVVITGPGGYDQTDTIEIGETDQWSYTVPAANVLPEGQSTVNASAVDESGNSSVADAVLTLAIDTIAPTSAVAALPDTSAPVFYVRWSGDDGTGSGIESYDVHVSENGGDYSFLQAGTTDTQVLFTGELDITYGLYSIARDIAGNVEQKALAAEAETTVTRQWATPGDTNMDCTVNVLDLIHVRNLLQTDPDSGDNWQADVNTDGVINILDMLTVRNGLNTSCP